MQKYKTPLIILASPVVLMIHLKLMDWIIDYLFNLEESMQLSWFFVFVTWGIVALSKVEVG